MARPVHIQQFCGAADDHEQVMSDPRRALARALYVPRADAAIWPKDSTLPRWQLPFSPHAHAARFDSLLRQQRLFVVGGLNFVIKMGLLASWTNEAARRREALDLIDQRGWRPVLDGLGAQGKDPEDNLIGQDTVNRLYRTLPAIERENGGQVRTALPTQKEAWDGQLLRLRKAIELITLWEVTLRDRFRNDESLNRFRGITGYTATKANADQDAALIWNFLWIEPVLFQLENRARTGDIVTIINNPKYLEKFRAASGQGVSSNPADAEKEAKGVLYWALRGAPGKWTTIDAAAQVVNLHYAQGDRAIAATLDPDDYIDRIRKRPKHETEAAHEHVFENLLTLGPTGPTEVR